MPGYEYFVEFSRNNCMRILLKLIIEMRLIVVLSICVISTVQIKEKPISNKIYDDILTCAASSEILTEDFEQCPIWPETGIYPFCVYMRVPSNETNRGESIYGCVYNHALPEECLQYGEFYTQYATVAFRNGVKRSGPMMCCADNYCNRIDDPMVAMVRMAEVKKEESIWPAILLVIIFNIFPFVPLIQYKLSHRHSLDSQQAEVSEFIEGLVIGETDLEQIPPTFEFFAMVQEMPMQFPDYKKMLSTVRNLSHNFRQTSRSRTSWNSDTANNGVDYENKVEVVDKEYTADTMVHVYQKCRHTPSPVNRTLPSRYESLAERLIEHGPYQFKFDPVELGDLFDTVTNILKREPTLLKIDAGVLVLGNIEGNYGDLFRWLNRFGWPPKQKLLFLGGLSSREEEYSLETIALIFALKRSLPRHVFILRGAAETYPLNLRRRMPVRIADALSDVILRAYQYLPVAALIGHNILACHGCIPEKLSDIRQISHIRRPLKEITMGTLAADLIFSKAGTRKGLIGGARGSRFRADFVPEVMTGFSPDHFVKLVVRARNSCADGFIFHNRRLLTLWSTASNSPIEWKKTKDKDDHPQMAQRDERERFNGACLYISPELKLTFTKMAPYNTWPRDLIQAMTKRIQSEDPKLKKKKPKRKKN